MSINQSSEYSRIRHKNTYLQTKTTDEDHFLDDVHDSMFAGNTTTPQKQLSASVHIKAEENKELWKKWSYVRSGLIYKNLPSEWEESSKFYSRNLAIKFGVPPLEEVARHMQYNTTNTTSQLKRPFIECDSPKNKMIKQTTDEGCPLTQALSEKLPAISIPSPTRMFIGSDSDTPIKQPNIPEDRSLKEEHPPTEALFEKPPATSSIPSNNEQKSIFEIVFHFFRDLGKAISGLFQGA